MFYFCLLYLYYIFCDILFKYVSNDVFSVFFILFFLIILVTWTGNFSLLAWLAISVCCKISEVRRLFRQPTAWHVSLFGTTGYFICRGNKCILLNVHNYNWNYICRSGKSIRLNHRQLEILAQLCHWKGILSWDK